MATEQPLSQFAVFSARPTLRIDQQEQPLAQNLLISMQMNEQEGGLSAVELRFSNVASRPDGDSEFAFEDNAVLQLGATIAIFAGDENAPQEIFQGTITGLEAEYPEISPPELVVLAEDAAQQARMARRTQLFEDATLADIAGEIANRLNLTPVTTGFTDNIGPQMQLNESDLAFLRRLLQRFDGDVQVVGRELHVSPRGEVRRGTVDLILHSQLRQARVLADLAHQVTELTVAGWNGLSGERVTGQATGRDLGPGQGTTGASILEQKIGDRHHHVSHLAVTTSEEAQAAADAAFDQRARRFVCVEGTAEGNPALRVGTELTLGGLGSRFDNTYYVVQTCHRWDTTNGYETDFRAESAFINE